MSQVQTESPRARGNHRLRKAIREARWTPSQRPRATQPSRRNSSTPSTRCSKQQTRDASPPCQSTKRIRSTCTRTEPPGVHRSLQTSLRDPEVSVDSTAPIRKCHRTNRARMGRTKLGDAIPHHEHIRCFRHCHSTARRLCCRVCTARSSALRRLLDRHVF
jgi:hypothetical protein